MAAVRNIIVGILFFLLGCNNSISETGVVVSAHGDTLAELPVDTVIIVPVSPDPGYKAVDVLPPLTDTIYIDTVPEHPTLTEIYLSQVGVREATGRNDGPQVEMYLHSVGLGKGYAWCAAFVHWCLDSAGIRNTVTAWSPSAHNSKNIIWNGKRFLKEPEPGDVGCLYYHSLKRIGHTFFYHRRINSSVYDSVEGNTNAEGSREGHGVYQKKRSFNATYSLTRWQ